MADKQQPENAEGSQTQPNPASTNADFDIGGSVGGNVTVGNNNTVINNYYPVVEKNTEKHEPDFWALKHPYPMPPNFTGRIAERALLTHWLKEDSENRLFILRALGGFGKSALSWQWLTHDVDIKEYPKVVFWSFYEGDASFEHFIEETLKYLKLEVPQGQRPQVDELLKVMGSQKILLIMDGFERALRAYSSMNAAYQGDEEESPSPDTGRGDRGEGGLDCVNINAEIFLKSVCSLPNIKSKVLMTTRLTPRTVKDKHSGEFLVGCREVELTSMQPTDAVEFFHKQKIKGTHAEIEAACAPYGYHPLSLRILAGLVTNDREKPGDIIVANKLDITDDVIANKDHVLKLAYDFLSKEQQKLLSIIACFRAPMTYDALKAISSKTSRKGKKAKVVPNENLSDDLKTLEKSGLLHWDRKSNKYDLHPIVRRYAYERLASTDRVTAHTRLRDYFAEMQEPENIEDFQDISPWVELYHHTVITGKLDEAIATFHYHLFDDLFYQSGNYHLLIELAAGLFPNGENKLPPLKRADHQSTALTCLAASYSQIGQPRRAIPLLEMANDITENKIKDKDDVSAGLTNIAYIQLPIGALRTAESNLRRSIKLSRVAAKADLNAVFGLGAGHAQLGHMLLYTGLYNEAQKEFSRAIKQFEIVYENEYIGIVWSYRTQLILLMAREESLINGRPSNLKHRRFAIQAASYALELAEEFARTQFPLENDLVRAHWQLGAAYRFDYQLELAEQHLSEALTRDRAINYVVEEANILLDIARLRYDQKNYEEAKSLTEEALAITERCGYVLQGADVNLFLAQYALEQEKDKVKAKEYAEEAKKLATCDGPPYYYKVAYHEAERFLENLK